MSCVLVFLMAIDIIVLLVGCLYPLLLYSWGRGYKEGSRVGYNMISIRILSLLAYFTYIFIDIMIYALGSTPCCNTQFLQIIKFWSN
jgi:hypothetical protein